MHYPSGPMGMIASLRANSGLAWQLVRREVAARYRGSFLGVAWSLITPLVMLTLYTFVFSVVFKAKWRDVADVPQSEFALTLFIGLIFFNLFNECLFRAPTLVTSNVNLVKKVVFPLEILPLVTLGSACFQAAVSFVVFLGFAFVTGYPLPLTALYLPVMLPAFMLMTLGISWILASMGVYLRDINQSIGLISTMLMFMSPIFYPITALPAPYRRVLMLNPLTFVIEQARHMVLWGSPPDLQGQAAYLAMAVIMACIGFWWFQKTRSGFADVL